MFDLQLPDPKVRTKDIQEIQTNIDGAWIPMYVCALCGSGPVVSDSNDDCCEFRYSRWMTKHG